MNSDAQIECLARTMTYLEARHFIEQIKRQVANFDDMTTLIGHRYTADHHIRITNCLYLLSLLLFDMKSKMKILSDLYERLKATLFWGLSTKGRLHQNESYS